MDSGWIKALELPTKITGGVFGACVLIYFLHQSEQITLADIGAWVLPTVLITGALSGCIFLTTVIANLWEAYGGWRQRRAEKALEDKIEKTALAHLDNLSEQEIYIVAQALKEESPSITLWAHSSGAAQLVSKRLLLQHGGEFMTEHWPFTFLSFAWDEIVKRKEFFLEKENELEAMRKRKGR